MTTELSDRALDEAAALAMGCDQARYRGDVHPLTPRYSTDPATDAPKLAWLMQYGDVEIVAWRDLTVEAALIGSDKHRCDARKNGASIQQALARLVVRVAEMRARGGA